MHSSCLLLVVIAASILYTQPVSGDFDLEPLLRQLAAEFTRRDMRGHVELLRGFYRRYARAKHASVLAAKPVWEVDLVLEWMCMLRIPPFEHAYAVLPGVTKCPTCVGIASPTSGVFTHCAVPGLLVLQCLQCGGRWLVPKELRP